MAEWRVVDHDVAGCNAFFQIGFQDIVGQAWIHIVRADQYSTFNALAHQIINLRNRLLVRCSTGVVNVLG